MLEVNEDKRASLHDLEKFFALDDEKPQPSTASNSPFWAEKSEKPSILEPSVQTKVLNRNFF
jgi:hypothetical protein